ncbi:hypothetical protein ACPZ19_05985 [Amycolatopsis lurida]
MTYRTTLLLPGWAAWFLRAVAAGCALLSVALWLIAGDEPVPCAVATVVLLAVAIPLASACGRVEVDAEQLRLVVVPLFRKTLPRSEVTSVELSEVDPWREFHGFGYRLRGGGLVGFVFRRGPAVRLTTRDGRTYVISDPAAEDLLSALRG